LAWTRLVAAVVIRHVGRAKVNQPWIRLLWRVAFEELAVEGVR
jgi:hypothetical protein